jgi:2-amino-4-hydroxy-6-hydroxymethyldihydropteridine diphosphokinase
VILIALGANLDSAAGPPRLTLACALGSMAAERIRVLKVSSFYQTPAWPDPSDPPFVNAVAQVQTPLGPASLMAALHRIETLYGRVRQTTNAPRTLDLDLLDYGGRIDSGPPVLPHPRIAERGFVLVPLADVAPDWRHPKARLGIRQMIESIPAAEREAIRRLES